MSVHVLDGMTFTVDRGPNWLFVKLRPRKNFATDLPALAERLLSIASRHFIYRVVLELDELRTMPNELVAQLVRLQEQLAEYGGALRLCGLSAECAETLCKRNLDAALPNHETRQAAVLGCDVAALRQKLKEVASSTGDDAEMVDSSHVWQQPCLQ